MRKIVAKRLSMLDVFIAIVLSSVFIFVVMCLFTKGDTFAWLVMQNNYDWQFSDWFRQIVYASDLKNIYFNTNDAPFPPFIYLFFHFLYILNPMNIKEVSLDQWKVGQENNQLLLFVLFTVLICISLYILVDALLKESSTLSKVLFWLCIVSAPFVWDGAIERGNIAILVVVFLIVAIAWKDSTSTVKKEFALICIALAAGCKIYPAIFGLLYIKEKRWKECFRLILYGGIVGIGPFVFTGGLKGLIQYIYVLRGFEIGWGVRWTSIRNYLLATVNFFGGNVALKQDIICFVIENVYLVLILCAFFKCKSKWNEIFYLSAIIATYVSNSYRYVACYMIIPCIFLFANDWDKQALTKGKAILFALIFSIPCVGYFFKINVDFMIFTMIYLCIVIVFIKDIKDYKFFKIKKFEPMGE